jgi:type I restriction enzyme R subunit
MKEGGDQVDYLPYLSRKIVGVIEAKPIGTRLSGVERDDSPCATVGRGSSESA